MPPIPGGPTEGLALGRPNIFAALEALGASAAGIEAAGHHHDHGHHHIQEMEEIAK
jgi:hypothetical protein